MSLKILNIILIGLIGLFSSSTYKLIEYNYRLSKLEKANENNENFYYIFVMQDVDKNCNLDTDVLEEYVNLNEIDGFFYHLNVVVPSYCQTINSDVTNFKYNKPVSKDFSIHEKIRNTEGYNYAPQNCRYCLLPIMVFLNFEFTEEEKDEIYSVLIDFIKIEDEFNKGKIDELQRGREYVDYYDRFNSLLNRIASKIEL